MTYVEETISPNVNHAIWQYLIDHSKIQSNGYLGVLLYFRDKADFWRRVQSRYDGYSRKDIEKIEEKACKQHIIWTTYKYYKKMSKKNYTIATRIDKDGSLKEKVCLWLYRKTRNYLFK